MIAEVKHEFNSNQWHGIKTIKLLQSGTWYGHSETIEIAKGKNAIPKTWKEAKEKIRRRKYMETDKGRKTLSSCLQNIALKIKIIKIWPSRNN